ncbi:hypothetical protein GG681_11675 [Epibacterium sp. SM1969]|uniref:Uncharacterized protein n=1 Tax=Tritonibacter aquimaris TaxID=2663379 RepID=A0A844AZ92_9RHOB|nr:hypothetical protein [Tritonibacter aquimaris]MQY43302.1 hypothetical protein [Tritonibacter aquimaris]
MSKAIFLPFEHSGCVGIGNAMPILGFGFAEPPELAGCLVDDQSRNAFFFKGLAGFSRIALPCWIVLGACAEPGGETKVFPVAKAFRICAYALELCAWPSSTFTTRL